MNRDDHERLAELAELLGRLDWLPNDLLADLVRCYGVSVWLSFEDEQPQLTGTDDVDREIAARLCAGCPVWAECLELELRQHGEHTAGVWGGLSEQDRRYLYWLWRAEDRDGGEPR